MIVQTVGHKRDEHKTGTRGGEMCIKNREVIFWGVGGKGGKTKDEMMGRQMILPENLRENWTLKLETRKD